ncbi:hypothetical protein BBJ28_00023623, partial [Nothophytophthora sp. Chile5]
PKFAQIYIVDPDMRRRTERRQGIFSSLDPVHLMDLEDLMARYNPFAQQFLTFGERLREDIASGKEVVDIVYKLHADHRHPGTHNLPTASEVAATMVEDENLDKHRDLLLYARDRGLLRLFETSPMYDPLQYPLLFPLGDLGWTFTDTYADGNQRRNNTKMSLREHVAFRLFQKTNDGSVLHLGGRLFQQWTVDQQAKAEQERLRWVAGHQKDIRADQYKGFEDALLNESTAGKTHSITKLIVHLDGYQMVLFRADDNPEENDAEWFACMDEASAFKMPYQLRQLFATLLVYSMPNDVRAMWDQFYEELSRDFAYRHRDLEGQTRDDMIKFQTLKSLQELLEVNGMAVSDFDLPQLSEFPELVLTSLMENGLIRREMEGYNHGRLQEIVDETDQLNDGQRRSEAGLEE